MDENMGLDDSMDDNEETQGKVGRGVEWEVVMRESNGCIVFCNWKSTPFVSSKKFKMDVLHFH